MASEWSEYTLHEVGLLQRGKSKHRPRWAEHLYGGDYPFIQTGDIRKAEKTITEYEQTYSDAGLKQSKLWPKGTLCITIAANIAEIGILNFDSCFPDSVLGFKANEGKTLDEFVYYILKNFKTEIQRHAIGSVQDNINLGTFNNISFKFPPLSEQKAIAHILGSLDDKIELNRQMNQTFEQMAQSMFKSWFVDFEPVIDNALEQGNEIPEELQGKAEQRRALSKERKPLPDHIQNLFPSEFEFSDELDKWIPKGWKSQEISHLAILNPESWTSRNYPDKVKYVDLSNAKDGIINSIVEYEMEDAPSRAKRILKKNDTIFGTVRPGNRSFAYLHEDGLTGSTGFAVLRPKKGHYKSFVYLYLTQDDIIDFLSHIADGAAYPAVRPEVVSTQKTVIPSEEILEKFEDIVSSNLEKIGYHLSQQKILTKLRDTLLPKLISGEVKVGEFDHYITGKI